MLDARDGSRTPLLIRFVSSWVYESPFELRATVFGSVVFVQEGVWSA